jgi:spoIIIJ-associated protein
MDYSEKWGNSVDEAVELALKDLKLTIDEVDVEVLEEPTKGILGLGRKPGLVRVTKKGATAEKTDGDAAFEEVRAQVSGTKKEEVKEEPVAAEAKAEEAPAQEEAAEAAPKEEEPSPFGAGYKRPEYGVIDLRSKGDKKPQAQSSGRSGGRRERDGGRGRDRDRRRRDRGGKSDAQLTNVNTEAISIRPDDLIPVESHEALDFLKETTVNMGLDLAITAQANDEYMYINLEGKDAGAIIGKRGQTLDAIQYLTSLVVNKDHNKYVRVVVDAENYRAKREKTLQQLAIRLGTKVLRTGRPVRLEPMNPYERMVIHATLHQSEEVTTKSEGEEPYRRVIIERK